MGVLTKIGRFFKIKRVIKNNSEVYIRDDITDTNLWVYPYVGEKVRIKTNAEIRGFVRFVDHENIYRHRAGINSDFGLEIDDIDIDKSMLLIKRKKNKLKW